MRNGKKLGPVVIFTLVLTLSPIAWAEGPASASSLGPLDWLRAWIVQLLEEFDRGPAPAHGCAATDRGCWPEDHDGPSIIPSG